MNDPNNPNMVRYIGKLDAAHQQIICAAVRTHAHSKYQNAYAGILPFIPVRVCVQSVKMALETSSRRDYAVILALIESHLWLDTPSKGERARMLRQLNDAMVHKHFGYHPERGVVIPGLMAIEKVERERGLFEGKQDANDMLRPMVVLRNLAKDYWQVECAAKYRFYVDGWLVDNCS